VPPRDPGDYANPLKGPNLVVKKIMGKNVHPKQGGNTEVQETCSPSPTGRGKRETDGRLHMISNGGSETGREGRGKFEKQRGGVLRD